MTHWTRATGHPPTIDGILWVANDAGLVSTGIAANVSDWFDSSSTQPPTEVSGVCNFYKLNATV
jgi:hypothetical protein